MSEPTLAAPFKRPYLLASIALHAALAGCLYYFGSYQLELRREEERVTSSVRATHHARTARRVDDLKKIKELLEKSAMREAQPEDTAGVPAPTPLDSDPQEMLREARELSKSIDDINRDIKAEELARLTGKPKEQARAEIDAQAPPEMPRAEGPADKPVDDPLKEIAKLEAAARDVLAKRAETLQRQQDGVPVDVTGAPAGSAADQAGTGGQAGAASSQSAQPGQGTLPGQGAEQSDVGGSGGSGTTLSGHGQQGRVAAQIAAFMREGVEPEKAAPSRRYRGGEGRFFHEGIGQIPPVNVNTMIKARGRMLGSGGQFANRIYLNSWYLIGPFPGRHGAGLFNNPKYPPEDAVLLDAVYRGKDNRLLKWEYVNAPSYPLIPRDHAEDAVYYGYTEIYLDQERELMVWIGADDDAQVHLNDKLMWKGGNLNKQWFWDTLYGGRNTYVRDYNRTEGKKLVRFQKGRNKIFFKLSNGPTRLFFSMVLTLPPAGTGA